MSDYFIIINGANGRSSYTHDESAVMPSIDNFNRLRYTISAMALGYRELYAVVCSNGEWDCSNKAPQSFVRKLKAINRCNISQISFGYDGSWAIVMKSGWCHTESHHSDDGPLDAINKHNGNIKYVSMTDQDSEWIVGYGKNGVHKCGLTDSLNTYLADVNRSKKRICSVELGGDKNTWLVRTEESWRWSASSNFTKKVKGNNQKRLAVLY
eukprot:317941_1